MWQLPSRVYTANITGMDTGVYIGAVVHLALKITVIFVKAESRTIMFILSDKSLRN
jgi:hypothetical protein